MPKIIKNLKEQIQEEARKQILSKGYLKTTVRSVAKECGIGSGTVYNYFKSKDEMITSFMVEDWRKCMKNMMQLTPDEPERYLRQIHSELSGFVIKYKPIFIDPDALNAFAVVLTERHAQLVEMMGKLIEPICKNTEIEDRRFLINYVADTLLRWTTEGVEFDKQYSIIKMLLR